MYAMAARPEAAHPEESQHRPHAGEQHHHLERDRNERRERIPGFSPDVDGPVRGGGPILEPKLERRAEESQRETDPGECRSFKAHGLVETVHGVRREDVYDLQSAPAGGIGCLNDRILRIEDANQGVLTST